MKNLVAFCSFVIIALFAWSAGAAENWVYGTAGTMAVAKEAALETASANLPAGVPFHVVEENFVGDDYKGWRCNILVRYGTGVTAIAGVPVYYSTTQAARAAKAATKTTKTATKPTKSTKAPPVPHVTVKR